MANVEANWHSRLQAGDRALRVHANTALLLIDVQQAIDDPQWTTEGRNNPQAERNMASFLATWRHVNYPILHIRHDSTFSDSPYRPGQPGNEFKMEARPAPGERIVVKRTIVGSSAPNWRTGQTGATGARPAPPAKRVPPARPALHPADASGNPSRVSKEGGEDRAID